MPKEHTPKNKKSYNDSYFEATTERKAEHTKTYVSIFVTE